MILAVPREITPHETRVALIPELVSRYRDLGLSVRVEKDAGVKAGFRDESYRSAGAEITENAAALYHQADLILKIWAPLPQEDRLINPGSVVIANFQNRETTDLLPPLAERGVTAFALNRLPRISRAQSMDILSSQSNLAGYKAVITAADLYGSAMPLMMTAAGTVTPARVLVLGAGVAGLQAIATARRLGAQVYASDVRPAVKEQVESLGAKFVDVAADGGFETAGGYAAETTPEYKQAQEQAVAARLRQTDIAITTALIPGRRAPTLIRRCLLKQMPAGAVIIDMAAASGGNVEGSQDGKLVEIDGVKILGAGNLAAGVPHSASRLFARNIYNFIQPMYHRDSRQIIFNFEDELVAAACVIRRGEILLKE